jgi:hypothetical protein
LKNYLPGIKKILPTNEGCIWQDTNKNNFYKDYFDRDINSKQIIVYRLKTKQRQTSTHILLTSQTYIQISC